MFSKIKEINKRTLTDCINTSVSEPSKFNSLLNVLDASDFYYAPAAKKYHDNYPGGLFDHCLGLYRELKDLKVKMNKNWTEEEMIVIAFGHDLCKVGLYVATVSEDRVVTYDINPDRMNKDEGHGVRSLSILAQVCPELLNDRIAKCIVCHMGMWTKDVPEANQYILNAQTEDDMVFFTHAADMISSRKSRGLEVVRLGTDGTVFYE